MTAKLKTIRREALDYPHSDADLVGYLEAALEQGDSALVTAVLGDIARGKGMTKVAEGAGLGRESLYKALSRNGNPELSTVLRVMKALGLRFRVSVADEPRSKRGKRRRRSKKIWPRVASGPDK